MPYTVTDSSPWTSYTTKTHPPPSDLALTILEAEEKPVQQSSEEEEKEKEPESNSEFLKSKKEEEMEEEAEIFVGHELLSEEDGEKQLDVVEPDLAPHSMVKIPSVHPSQLSQSILFETLFPNIEISITSTTRIIMPKASNRDEQFFVDELFLLVTSGDVVLNGVESFYDEPPPKPPDKGSVPHPPSIPTKLPIRISTSLSIPPEPNPPDPKNLWSTEPPPPPPSYTPLHELTLPEVALLVTEPLGKKEKGSHWLYLFPPSQINPQPFDIFLGI